jgi:hypothetical protein
MLAGDAKAAISSVHIERAASKKQLRPDGGKARQAVCQEHIDSWPSIRRLANILIKD